MPQNKVVNAVLSCTLSVMVNIDVQGMYSPAYMGSEVEPLPALDVSDGLFFEKRRDFLKRHYKETIETFIKHSLFLQSNAVDVSGHFNAQEKNTAISLRQYVNCMRINIRIFRAAEKFLSENPPRTMIQAMTEKELLQLAIVIASDEFKSGYKEFELMTCFNLSCYA